jgi:signal transduction histidine kinase
MPLSAEFGRTLGLVLAQRDPEEALMVVAEETRRLTGSRNVLIATVNEELGDLEIRYGAGDEWSAVARNRRLRLGPEVQDGVVGRVAATGDTFVTGSRDHAPAYQPIFSASQSEIAVPVRDSDGRVRAVLNLETDRQHAYGLGENSLVSGLAHLVAIVLERKDSDLRERAMLEIGQALDRYRTEEQLVQGVIRVAEDTLRLHSCSIFLWDPRRERLTLQGTIGRLRDQVGVLHYEIGEGFTGWVAEHRRPILLDDPQQDPRWRGKYVEFPNEEIASFLAVPIVHSQQLFGVIRVLRRKPDNPFVDNRFSSTDLRLLTAISTQLAVGLEHLRQMQNELRNARMIAWGELSAKSSHMIGNRVFALKGDVNELGFLLGEAQLERETLMKLQSSLMTNVTRIEEILQDFRDFLTATQITTELQDVSQLVKETLDEVFPKRGDVQLARELEGQLYAELDARRLRRAVSELVENSLNFMPEGKLSVRTYRQGTQAVIEIEDTGPGVDEGMKQRIFEPFYSGRVKGMGLGLSIVKGIVDGHGGSITEEGKPGLGARFVIRLRAETPPANEPDAAKLG